MSPVQRVAHMNLNKEIALRKIGLFGFSMNHTGKGFVAYPRNWYLKGRLGRFNITIFIGPLTGTPSPPSHSKKISIIQR